MERWSGSADEDARSEERGVGGRYLALAGRAREDEVVAVDDGGAADEGDSRRIDCGLWPRLISSVVGIVSGCEVTGRLALHLCNLKGQSCRDK